MTWYDENGTLPLWFFLLKTYMRKISDKFQLRNFLQKPDQYFSKLPRSSKTRKVQETVTAKKSLRRHGE